jgi:hypothetical protein
MTLGSAIDEALQTLGPGEGTVTASSGGRSAEVDVLESDRLGVRVKSIRVKSQEPIDVVERAAALPERMRSLPDAVEPVEVDPALGGAILRTVPDEVRDREFFEIDVRTDGVGVKRYRADDQSGGREVIDFTLTRKGLGKLIDEIG